MQVTKGYEKLNINLCTHEYAVYGNEKRSTYVHLNMYFKLFFISLKQYG